MIRIGVMENPTNTADTTRMAILDNALNSNMEKN
jgi:hypothetical protein